jgi:hypothetical protein
VPILPLFTDHWRSVNRIADIATFHCIVTHTSRVSVTGGHVIITKFVKNFKIQKFPLFWQLANFNLNGILFILK